MELTVVSSVVVIVTVEMSLEAEPTVGLTVGLVDDESDTPSAGLVVVTETLWLCV